MSLFAGKCVRCGERTRAMYQNKATCAACRSQLELALAQSAESQRTCPVDGSVLAKEIAHGVIIDHCPVCRGVWLDAGEMERMNQDVVEEVWNATAFGRPLR
jgi:hypothetical protein